MPAVACLSNGGEFLGEVDGCHAVLDGDGFHAAFAGDGAFQAGIGFGALRQLQNGGGQVSGGENGAGHRHQHASAGGGEVELHRVRILAVRKDRHRFPVHRVLREHAGYVRAVGQLGTLLPVEEEADLVHRFKPAEGRCHALHHQQLFLRVGAAERFLAQIHPRLAAGDVQVDGHALGDDVGQPHAGGGKVIFGGFHHQRQGGLGNAVLHGNPPRHGHQIAVPVLIPADRRNHVRIRRVRAGRSAHRRRVIDHGRRGFLAAAQGQHHHQRRGSDNQQPLHIHPAGQLRFPFGDVGKFHIIRLLVRLSAA